MELALYCPLCGYYEKKTDTPGRRGDFFTSVSVGSLFGELLAFQFAEWLNELLIADSRVQLVEAGAHDGRLAKDILAWLRLRRPGVFERIEYGVIEPSTRRQEWQRVLLGEFGSRVRWFADLHALAENSSVALPNPQLAIRNRQFRGVCGVIFSNELLDAMPLQRIGWDSKRRMWFEWGVTLEGDKFTWCRLDKLVTAPFNESPELLEVLPDGFTTEVCPAADSWWCEAASVLNQGRLLTLDYGLNESEFFTPQRAGGTLRAYRQHRLADDVLAHPGEQDLTAHVNFTALKELGEHAGLNTESDFCQSEFLTAIVQRAWQSGDFEPWTTEHTRQFQTLTHPEHLGRAFRVLVQSRGGA